MADVRCCLLAYFIPPSRLLLKLEEAQDIVNQKVFLTRYYVCERNCTTAESIPPRLLFITFPVAAVLFLNVYLFFIIICCCVCFGQVFCKHLDSGVISFLKANTYLASLAPTQCWPWYLLFAEWWNSLLCFISSLVIRIWRPPGKSNCHKNIRAVFHFRTIL